MEDPPTIVYEPAERPLCEVHNGWTWAPGEVRMWQRRPHGLYANVSVTPRAGATYLKTVPATHVRGVEVPEL